MNAIPKSALIISVLTCINLAGLNMAKAAGDSDLISAETYFHVDHSDVLLKAFNVIVEMGEIEGNVSLNQISDAKFRFFLIDADRAAQDGVSRIGGVSVDKIRGNFLVDQDGDIFIGSRFISFILVNAFNDVLGLAQAHSVLNSSLISGDSEEAAGDLAGLMGSVADIDRISLIRRFAEGSNSDFDLTGLADLSNSLMGMLGMEDLLVFSLAPIVLHEIGHIENGSQGFFLSEVLENYIKSRMLRDEEKADEFAVEKLKTLLENYSQKTSTHKFAFNIQATRATLKLLHDQVYFDAFEELRGLSAESYIKRVFYRSCLKEPSITDYPINSIDRILFILDMEYPVLTEQEFLDVRNGFLSSLNSGTHSHHASRVQRYGAAISSYAVDHGGGDVYSEVDPALSSFLNNEPKELAVFELQNGIGVTFSQFTRPFDDHFTFSEAVNCSSKCWVGREKNGGASIIEIVGKEENLTEVRMMTRVALPDEQSANQREQYVNNIGYMARFFLSANRRTAEMSQEQLDEGGVMSDVLKKMTDARDVALQCGVATDVYQLDGLLHEIRTISRGGWMQVSISKGTDG